MDIGVDIAEQLFPNPFTFIFTLMVTGVLFFFMYKYLFDPAREMIAKRADYVQGKILDADNINKEAQDNLIHSKEEIIKAQALSKEIIDTAKKEANEIKEDYVKAANQKAEQIYQRANDSIAKKEAELLKDINKQIVDVALAASEKLIVDKQLDKQDALSIEKFIEEMNDDKGNK